MVKLSARYHSCKYRTWGPQSGMPCWPSSIPWCTSFPLQPFLLSFSYRLSLVALAGTTQGLYLEEINYRLLVTSIGVHIGSFHLFAFLIPFTFFTCCFTFIPPFFYWVNWVVLFFLLPSLFSSLIWRFRIASAIGVIPNLCWDGMGGCIKQECPPDIGVCLISGIVGIRVWIKISGRWLACRISECPRRHLNKACGTGQPLPWLDPHASPVGQFSPAPRRQSFPLVKR